MGNLKIIGAYFKFKKKLKRYVTTYLGTMTDGFDPKDISEVKSTLKNMYYMQETFSEEYYEDITDRMASDISECVYDGDNLDDVAKKYAHELCNAAIQRLKVKKCIS